MPPLNMHARTHTIATSQNGFPLRRPISATQHTDTFAPHCTQTDTQIDTDTQTIWTRTGRQSVRLHTTARHPDSGPLLRQQLCATATYRRRTERVQSRDCERGSISLCFMDDDVCSSSMTMIEFECARHNGLGTGAAVAVYWAQCERKGLRKYKQSNIGARCRPTQCTGPGGPMLT